MSTPKIKKKVKPGSTPKRVPVVRLTANVEDQASGKAFNRYAFRKVGGGTGHRLVERSKVADARALGQILLDANADLPVDPCERAVLLAELIKAQPEKLGARVAKVGWVNGQNVFVRHGGVAGTLAGQRKLQPPTWADGARHRCNVKGNSDAWLKQVAPAIRRSSRMQLACATIYAAPLVRLVNLQPFSIVLFGPSSVGKSSVILVAGSLLGLGTKEAIPNWNLSFAGLQETAARFNDHALLIDETGSADLPKAGLYDLFRRVTYTYAEGADRLRHSGSGFASSRDAADAKGTMFTTSEHSLDAMATMGGKKRDHGEIARAFNVPAVREGHTTIFDLIPDELQGTQREKWIAETFAMIRSGCLQHHGGPFKRFLAHIVAMDRAALIGTIESAMQEFQRGLALQSDVGAVRHAAKNFALVYAGGAIGIEAGVLPVKKERLLKSIVSCFNDGLAALALPKDLEANAVKQLRAGIAATPLPEKAKFGDTASLAGFWRPVGDDDPRKLLAVKPAIFRAWFPDDAHWAASLRWLHAKGDLLLLDGQTLPVGPISTAAVVTFEKLRLADGTRDQGRWIRFIDSTSV